MRYSIFLGHNTLAKHRFMSVSSQKAFLSGQPQPLVAVCPQPSADAFVLYRRLARTDRPSFLLESGKGTSATARYSFLGSDPYLTLTGRGEEYQIETLGQIQTFRGSAFRALQQALPTRRSQDRTASRHFTVGPSATSVTISSVHSNHSLRWPLTISICLICTWFFWMWWPLLITGLANCT